jgi:hypothetical protein
MADARIALLGNCQATSLARILNLVAPSIQVVKFLFSDLSARFPTRAGLFAELARFDAVFSQPFGPGLHPELDGMILRERFKDKFCFYPIIEFNAFHPDCVYIWHRTLRQYCISPIGDYHSAIVFLGFSLGLTPEQTVPLYDYAILNQLGYFGFWKIAEDSMFQQCRSVDFPIQEMYRSWLRRCPFMHSINHPKLFVLGDVARGLLKKAGIPSVSADVDNYLPDEALFDPVWPIYPEIGKAMGIDGAYIFKRGCRTDGNPFLSLEQFVNRSYDLYREYGIGSLECPRVEEWVRNTLLASSIREFACARSVSV